jgi:hypothetical protein
VRDKFIYLANGPKKGETVRVPMGWDQFVCAVPIKMILAMSDDASPMPSVETVTYRQLYGGIVVWENGYEYQEWSIDGVWDDEMRNDFFASVAILQGEA